MTICRLSGCAHDARGPEGFCAGHRRRYRDWRARRDALVAEHLAHSGRTEAEELEPGTASLLDALIEHLLPLPFGRQGAVG
jgi:hypothetical protein